MVGWGRPVRPTVKRLTGAGSALPRACWSTCGDLEAALISPKVERAIRAYRSTTIPATIAFWPGPNSNTFTATGCARCPVLEATLPSNAVGKDFALSCIGRGDRQWHWHRTSLWGLLSADGWRIEGIEVHLLGSSHGLDLPHPAVSSCHVDLPATASMMERVTRRRLAGCGLRASTAFPRSAPHNPLAHGGSLRRRRSVRRRPFVPLGDTTARYQPQPEQSRSADPTGG